MNIKKASITGGQIPKGQVKVSGAKNSATKLLAASLICDKEVILNNFPTELVDANFKFEYIQDIGGILNIDRDNDQVKIDSSKLSSENLDHYNYAFRTTYLLVPGLIKKDGKAKIPYPGGCKIGQRGYDLHMMVWEKLGAKVEEFEDHIEVISEGFIGTDINFPISTIGGTESALICGAIAKGLTTIRNAYISPEVEDLINFLRASGVNIKVVGNSFIQIEGQSYIPGSIYSIMPDRIEALTWMVYGILSKGDITILDVPFSTMDIPLLHLKEAGIDFYRNSKNIRISDDCLVNGIIQPFELATGTHPGIISDMQPFYTLLGLHADGFSRIFDYRYPERIKYCEELSKFYNDRLTFESGKITTRGDSDIVPTAAEVTSTDLRGSMALVIAALLSDGVSVINNVDMALRGYNNLQKKLSELGVQIEITDQK
ncbi:UDP-N-acetylglucosamine 1-carboxyvinyltransferase [Gillisia sp. Hel1_33_143]|uniref:UDP-N-acetylglucosamine 1-carboxyvinyltransferase n=1 Tax=Gillisia sp. Hel1_33_143 TaxID=1336796 RepID=UPI00087BC491|nr:UDP-N-acetylglucosamine 1-carboxyvinyltransferase [Gillisia sp. Hel1_33_143]SDS79941.1 UDP-N-acetylglucosamine 1-carboxyvinyltransferase [Gillisia sp. Hel1_33_143]